MLLAVLLDEEAKIHNAPVDEIILRQWAQHAFGSLNGPKDAARAKAAEAKLRAAAKTSALAARILREAEASFG